MGGAHGAEPKLTRPEFGHRLAQDCDTVDTRVNVAVNASILTTASLLVASLAAAFVMTGPDPFWQDGAGAMVAAGHLLLTAVAVVGALVGAARWSVGVGVGLTAALGGVAVLHPVGPAWIVMVIAAAAALAGLVGTGLRAVVRQRPPADAPPTKAAALALGLLTPPLTVGVVQPSGVDVTDWMLVAVSLAVGILYTRAGSRAVWVTRVGLPLLTLAVLAAVPLPGALLPLVAFGALSALSWTADARLAAVPLVTPGKRVPIPAELAPGEILDAAGLDDRGRRKEQP